MGCAQRERKREKGGNVVNMELPGVCAHVKTHIRGCYGETRLCVCACMCVCVCVHVCDKGGRDW